MLSQSYCLIHVGAMSDSSSASEPAPKHTKYYSVHGGDREGRRYCFCLKFLNSAL